MTTVITIKNKKNPQIITIRGNGADKFKQPDVLYPEKYNFVKYN